MNGHKVLKQCLARSQCYERGRCIITLLVYLYLPTESSRIMVLPQKSSGLIRDRLPLFILCTFILLKIKKKQASSHV